MSEIIDQLKQLMNNFGETDYSERLGVISIDSNLTLVSRRSTEFLSVKRLILVSIRLTLLPGP